MIENVYKCQNKFGFYQFEIENIERKAMHVSNLLKYFYGSRFYILYKLATNSDFLEKNLISV